MSQAVRASAYWRQAGMTYLDYLGVSGGAVRNALKEPAKSRATARAGYWYNRTEGPAGGAIKTPVMPAGYVKK